MNLVIVQLHRGNRRILEDDHEVHIRRKIAGRDLLDGHAVKLAHNALGKRLRADALELDIFVAELEMLVHIVSDVQRSSFLRDKLVVECAGRVHDHTCNRGLRRRSAQCRVKTCLRRPDLEAVLVDEWGRDEARKAIECRCGSLDVELFFCVALVNGPGGPLVLLHLELVEIVCKLLRRAVAVRAGAGIIVQLRDVRVIDLDGSDTDKFHVEVLREGTLRQRILIKSFLYLVGILFRKIDGFRHFLPPVNRR